MSEELKQEEQEQTKKWTNKFSSKFAAGNEDQEAQADIVEQVIEKTSEEYEQQIADLKHQILVSMADAQNLRQRTERQIKDAGDYALTSFARDLIEVVENLYRAIENAPESAENEVVKSMIDGVEMTRKSFMGTLEKYGVKRIYPNIGDAFNHEIHQAVTQIPTTEHKEGAVVMVMQAGYVIHDRLLRPAMVGVAKAS